MGTSWRILVSVAVLVVLFVFVLPRVVDYGDVLDSIRSLSWPEVVILSLVTIAKWAFEGMIYAATLPGLGPARGSIAYLSSTAAVNTVPGPVDLAVRYGMYRAWGYPLEQATGAVVTGGLFSTMSKLVLPAIALLVATVTASSQDGLGTYAIIGTAIAVGAVVFVVAMFRSKQMPRRVGDAFGRLASKVVGRFGKPPVEGVGDRLASVVEQSSTVLRHRWPMLFAASAAATAANFAVLLLSLRFSGVPEDVLGWVPIFVAFATVQFLTVVPITSGNVGITELVYIGTLGAAAGSDYAANVTAGVFVYRLFTWLAVIPIGWVTLLVWQAVHRRRGERVDLLDTSEGGVLGADAAPAAGAPADGSPVDGVAVGGAAVAGAAIDGPDAAVPPAGS